MIKKAVTIICLIFIILTNYLIKNSPSTGYEISIYTDTPPLIWIFLFGSIIGGMSLIVYQAFSRNEDNWWKIGFLILILDNFIIISLSGLRKYFLYTGTDNITHLQLIKTLIDKGFIEEDNFYPIIHIFSSQISEIVNVSPDIIVKFLPAYLSVLFLMLFNYLLAKSSLLEKGQILLASTASFVLFFNSLHTQIYPHVLSVLLFTLMLYLYFQTLKKSSWQFNILFIILLILLPYTHPSGSISIIFLLIVMELAKVYHEKIIYNSKIYFRKISTHPIIISSIVFFMWISSSSMFGTKFSSLWSSIFEPYKNQFITQTLKTTNRLELTEIIEYLFKMYGDTLIYILLGLVAGVIIIKRIKDVNIRYLFILLTFFIMSMPIGYILFIGVGSETIGRFINLPYMMIPTPVLVGFVLYELFKKKRLAVLIVLIILLSISTISVFSVYHSPWTYSPSWQITDMDMHGSKWFLSHRNYWTEFDSMGSDILARIAINQEPGLYRRSEFFKSYKIGLIPEHFNYPKYDTLGESMIKESYMLTNKRWKLANVESRLAKWRLNMQSGWGFDTKDINRLKEDKTVVKLYSNDEFEIFLILSNNKNGP